MCWEIYEKGTRCPKLLPCIHTFCLSCLKGLETNGTIKCPLCRQPHHIPAGQAENFPTNHNALKQVLWETKKKIYTLPSSGEAPRIDSGIVFCELHANSLFPMTDNAEGTEQSVCETCLNLDSCVISGLDSEHSTGAENGIMGRQDNWNGESGNDATSNRERGVVLLPASLTLPQPTWNTHIGGTTYCATFSKILRIVIFILTIPIVASVWIIIALTTMVVGVLFYGYFAIHYCIKAQDFPCTRQPVLKDTVAFVQIPINQYVYLIRRLFCWGDEDRESLILSKFCRGMAMVVIAFVISVSTIVWDFGILFLIIFIGFLIYFLCESVMKVNQCFTHKPRHTMYLNGQVHNLHFSRG